jgi:hypothetical protein
MTLMMMSTTMTTTMRTTTRITMMTTTKTTKKTMDNNAIIFYGENRSFILTFEKCHRNITPSSATCSFIAR